MNEDKDIEIKKIIQFIYYLMSNVHRGTSSVDYIQGKYRQIFENMWKKNIAKEKLYSRESILFVY